MREQTRSQRFGRRAALHRLVAAGGVTATSALIVSSPAFADSGSVACRPPTTSVTAAVAFTNPPGNSAPEFISITTPTGFTSCPCGGAAQYEFSFRIGSTSSGWVGTNTFSINTGSSQVVAAGVRVTCQGNGGVPAVRCLFSGTLTATPPANNSTNNYSLVLNQSSPPTGLPAC